MNIEDLTINDLAHDLCHGFEDEMNEVEIMNKLSNLIEDGLSLRTLWELNNYDSTQVYDLINNI